MKNSVFYLICIIVLGISSCSQPPEDPDFDSGAIQNDYLVYRISNHPQPPQLIFYEPVNGLHTQILSEWDIDEFSLSNDYRLAFSSSQRGSRKIYVLDYPFTENTPIEIVPEMFAKNTLLSWSPDGRYLLFDSVQAGNKKLSVWDGKGIVDIYNYLGQVDEVAWSLNGQLAFTDFYTFVSPHEGDSSEIFLWDGKATVSISQNPSGEDRFPAWNQDGQLAFLSERNDEHDIFIWDGVSKANGVPDVSTFVNIAPRLTQYYSDPTWTDSGSIAFGANPPWDWNIQIYEWDGQKVRNISKNQFSHNGGQTWRGDGYWSFITFFSARQNLYIRDEMNRTILKTKGQYTPAWSQNGLLIFCVPDYPGWTLSMWNEKNVIEVSHGGFIEAIWGNGTGVFCTSG